MREPERERAILKTSTVSTVCSLDRKKVICSALMMLPQSERVSQVRSVQGGTVGTSNPTWLSLSHRSAVNQEAGWAGCWKVKRRSACLSSLLDLHLASYLRDEFEESGQETFTWPACFLIDNWLMCRAAHRALAPNICLPELSSARLTDLRATVKYRTFLNAYEHNGNGTVLSCSSTDIVDDKLWYSGLYNSLSSDIKFSEV